MIQKVYNFVQQHNMIKAHDKLVVGVSGGADSVCLLMMLKELQNLLDFEMIVVHIEHGIRGDESIKDAHYVEELCDKIGVQFVMYSYKVEKLAKEWKLTVEEAGRKVRYESFDNAAKKYGANKIAVAHNMNDNAETVLLNLVRGSGLSGLHGIMPVRSSIIRPILCLERYEIEDYLIKNEIKYCIDSTNLENDYTRNKIRNQVLKTLQEEINPKAVDHIFASSKLILEAETFIMDEVEKKVEECCVLENCRAKIDINKFSEYNLFIKKEIIREIIRRICNSIKNYGNAHIESVLELEKMSSGRSVSLPLEITARRNFGYIDIFKTDNRQESRLCIQINIEGSTKICQDKEIELISRVYDRASMPGVSKKMYTKCFDYDKIKGNLSVRNKNDNDTIVINSKGNRQKLKKYFIGEKIPMEERDKILLVADADDVLWIIGHRISEKYKITDDTKRILELQMKGAGYDE